QIESACLGSEDVSSFELSDAEWSEASRIAHRNQSVVRKKEHRICAFDSGERIDDCVDELFSPRSRNAMQHDFGIACRREDRALGLQLCAQRRSKRQIAVMT